MLGVCELILAQIEVFYILISSTQESWIYRWTHGEEMAVSDGQFVACAVEHYGA